MNIDSLKGRSIYQDLMSAKGENERKGYLAGTIVGANAAGYGVAKVYVPLIKEARDPKVRNEFRCSKADIRFARLKVCGKMALFALLAAAGTIAAGKIGGAIGSLFDK